MSRASGFAALIAALCLPLSAQAVSVFLNGTKVDGLANTKIDKCGVEFDAKGNVQLSCAGYSVKVEGGAASQAASADDGPAPTVINRKYFLVTEQPEQGAADYDIEVFINSKFIRRLRSNEEQIVAEITRHLTPGKNTVTLVAKKKKDTGRKSFSQQHFFKVTIGEGNASGDRVMIDNALVEFTRTAAETQDVSQEYTLTAR